VPLDRLSRTARGECLGWQALLYAAVRETDQATAVALKARRESRGLEVRVLTSLAEAIIALGAGDEATAATRMSTVIDSGVWDPAVIAIRAAPALGAFVAEDSRRRGWLQQLLAASSDTSLTRRFGLQLPRAARGRTDLTPRENEVHELLAQGLTNEEIARMLYISLSTTKVHVKHIYAKLGVRSRLEAARALGDDV
jgi:DNA-binding NarL/FixJ family response regulator